MDNHVIPECYVDTKLIKTIAPPKAGNYNHQKGCPNVVKTMQIKFTDEFAIGIIDRDKNMVGYAEEFTLIKNVNDSLLLLKHLKKHQYLIIICPAIEQWLLNAAESVHISLNDFGLPDNLDELKKITKTSTSEDRDPHSTSLRRLFTELQQRGAIGVRVLSLWIQYLNTHNYQAEMSVIDNETEKILQA